MLRLSGEHVKLSLRPLIYTFLLPPSILVWIHQLLTIAALPIPPLHHHHCRLCLSVHLLPLHTSCSMSFQPLVQSVLLTPHYSFRSFIFLPFPIAPTQSLTSPLSPSFSRLSKLRQYCSGANCWLGLMQFCNDAYSFKPLWKHIMVTLWYTTAC